MTSLRYFGAMLLTFAIVACGGGSYSISVSDVEGPGNTTGTNGAGSGASGSVINYSTSKFIDSAVAGLYYSSVPSSTVGTTAPDGSFKYVAGDTVTFKIGGVDGLDIGSSNPVDGIPVVVTDLPGGEQVAQILQTFSTSANPSEKLDLSLIKFSADDVKALKKHIDDRGDLEVFKVGALATIAKSVSDSIGATLTPKSKSDVQAHLATSLADIIAAPRLSNQFYLLLTNYQDGNFNPAAFLGFSSSNKGFRIYDNGFNQISGTFIQGVDNVDMNLVNFQKINTEGNSYVDISSSANGCKASITEMTNWQSTDPASPTPQGFKANIKGPFSCAESSMNDTSGKTAILAAALDTSLKLADLSGKTLTTNLPKGNGTGCTNKVKFSFTPKSEFTLNVNAVVDPAESQTCKDSFNPDKTTLTFGQASPSGGSYIDGLFGFGIEYKNSSKRAIIFLSRLSILPNSATSNNPTANTGLLAYADNNTDKGNMQMKWGNVGPVELTPTPATSSSAAPIFSDQIYFVTQKSGNDVIPDSFIKFSSAGKLFNIYSTSFDKISGTFDQNSNNLELNLSRFQLSRNNTYTDAPYSVAGCKILATAITGSIDSEAGGSWGIRGFIGTGSSISYCTDQRVNGAGLSQQLVAIEIDTSPIFADFKGKTLETKVPSGTGCDKDKTVKFAISNSSTAGNSKKLDVTAVVDTGETLLCKATFDVPLGKLTFSQANPEGQDVPGLFTLNIEYSSGKYVTMFLMRPYFSTVPSNNFSANMISFLAYADNIGPDGITPTPYDLKIKSINGGPAKLTAP